MLFALVHVPVHVPRIDKILPLVPPDPTALCRTTGISAVARKANTPGSRTLYALNMPAPSVRAPMFTRQGRHTDPHGHAHGPAASKAARGRQRWSEGRYLSDLCPMIHKVTADACGKTLRPVADLHPFARRRKVESPLL